jgi:hypothetical protein
MQLLTQTGYTQSLDEADMHFSLCAHIPPFRSLRMVRPYILAPRLRNRAISRWPRVEDVAFHYEGLHLCHDQSTPASRSMNQQCTEHYYTLLSVPYWYIILLNSQAHHLRNLRSISEYVTPQLASSCTATIVHPATPGIT